MYLERQGSVKYSITGPDTLLLICQCYRQSFVPDWGLEGEVNPGTVNVDQSMALLVDQSNDPPEDTTVFIHQ